MNELLMSTTFSLVDTSNAITFIVAYGPTDTVSNTRELLIVLLVERPAATIFFYNRY